MKKRELTEEEKRLWQEELHGKKLPKKAPTKAPAVDKPVPKIKKSAPAAPKLVEGRAAKKLLKPYGNIEATLDLHGLNKLDAYEKVGRFLARAQSQGKRHVLIVTGKGKGILREALRRWLEDLPEYVVATSYARPEKGGDGAVHVVLKRLR